MSATAPAPSAAGFDPAPRAHRPRRRWMRGLIVAGAVIVILLGSGLAAGAIFYSQVTLPDQISLPERTTVYYSDGKTVMFQLGDENRRILSEDQINDRIEQATVAALDPDFWTDSGSPISRALIRVLEHKPASSSISDRATVYLASRKFEAKYSKNDILAMYLNLISFGRGAFGVEAAAGVYFGRTASRSGPPAQQVDTAGAVALAAMIGQPDPDPLVSAAAASAAQARFSHIAQSMVAAGYITATEANGLRYPPIKPAGSTVDQSVQPTGLIVQHVLSELRDSPQFRGRPKGYLENGGFDIITTIDPKAQAALEGAADSAIKGSVTANLPATTAVGAVMVQPGTGRVLAYFGNRDGGGADYAGWYTDADGAAVGYGAHPAGPTFAAYDLIAALKQGISLDARWSSPTTATFPESGRSTPVVDPNRATCQPRCTLTQAARASLTVPFFDLTLHLGAANVLDSARAVGINDMWDAASKRHDLRPAETLSTAMVPAFFDEDLGVGAYPVTVLDQASAMAALAAGGHPAATHFVLSVLQAGKPVYSERAAHGSLGLAPGQLGDLDAALGGTSLGQIKGIESATLVGTAPVKPGDAREGHAWTIGYSNSLALAVWVGDQAGGPVAYQGFPSAVAVPAAIYRAAMTSAYQSMGLKSKPFPPAGHTGDVHPPGAI